MNLKEMKNRLIAIGKEAKNETDSAKLQALLDEAEELQGKITDAENKARLESIAKGIEPDNNKEGEKGDGDAENKGKTLKNGGKITKSFLPKNAISSSATVLTHHTASDVRPAFNEASSLVDLVKVILLPGGESYKRGFVKGYGEGGYTDEGNDYNETEPEFGYADMVKTKITAYCEEPEEIAKLASSAYSDVIEGSTEIAIKKYLNKQILHGTGGAGKLYGIFYNPASADDDIIDRNKDLEISKITPTTLDEIVYAYGGDENVEAVTALILSKKDLKAFATLRNAEDKKVYNVVNNGNTGTIDGVPYVITSACPAVSDAGTDAGKYCMAYGSLHNYELPIFSDMEIQKSTDYKFKQGQIAHKGVIFAGGNVAAYNGFVRVKKSGEAAASAKASAKATKYHLQHHYMTIIIKSQEFF